MIKHILTFLAMVAPIYCFAESVYFGLYTDHVVSGQFNEANHVVLVQSDNGFTAGSMVNSYGRYSFMFGYMQESNKPVTFGLLLSTGYKPENFYLDHLINESPLIPMPVMSLNIPVHESVSIRANWISGVVVNAGMQLSI